MQFFWLGGSRYVYAISWRRHCHRDSRQVEHLLRRDNDDEQDWEDVEQDVEDEDSEGEDDDDYGYPYNDNRTDSDAEENKDDPDDNEDDLGAEEAPYDVNYEQDYDHL